MYNIYVKYICICVVISQRYIKYTLVHSSKLLDYFFLCPSYLDSLSRLPSLKVAIATSNFMNKV